MGVDDEGGGGVGVERQKESNGETVTSYAQKFWKSFSVPRRCAGSACRGACGNALARGADPVGPGPARRSQRQYATGAHFYGCGLCTQLFELSFRLSLSLSHSHSLSLSLFLYYDHRLSIYHFSLSLSLTHTLTEDRSTFLSLSLSLSIARSHALSLYFTPPALALLPLSFFFFLYIIYRPPAAHRRHFTTAEALPPSSEYFG